MTVGHSIALTALASVVLGGATAPAFAQEGYPSKPVRFIVPYPPGGSSDVLARVMAQKLTDALGRQVIVENRPGATGNIGHELAAKSPADGYTLLLTTKSQMVNNQYLHKRLPFDPLNDFSLVTMIAYAGHVLVVHPAVPARNVKELIALAKAKPGQLNFTAAAIGSGGHLAGERSAVVTASARKRPLRICGTAGTMSENTISICPPTTSETASTVPL